MPIIHAFLLCVGTLISSSPPGDEAARVLATGAMQPHVAIDREGNVYVVFIHQGNIAVAVSTDRGGSFGLPVVAIDAKGLARGGRQRGPRIGVDANKNLTVTCPIVLDASEHKKKYPTAELVLVTSRDGGRTWSSPVQVNEVAKKAPEALHWMAVAPTGEVHIAWLDLRDRHGSGQDIYYAQAVDGKVGKNHPVASTVCECCAPGLALDHEGNPVVAYREGGAKESREIFVVRSANKGRSFDAPYRINQAATQETGCPMSAPAIAVLGKSNTIAASWKDMRAGQARVFWTAPESPGALRDAPAHSLSGARQDHPSLATDGDGLPWLAWEERAGGGQQIWVRPLRADEPGRSISQSTAGQAGYPTIASNAGLVGVAYEVSKDGKSSVHFKLVKPS